MNPLVSIILPTYNGAIRISRAVQSVIAQEYQNWELIIISDGSTDDTAAVATSFASSEKRIIFAQNEINLGIQKTLNKGIAMANGVYIARIDDDDTWIDPDKLMRQVDFLEHNPDYVLVGTNAIICDEKGREIDRYSMPATDEAIRSRMLFKNCFLHPTIMARKDAIERVGAYNEETAAKHVEDYELWLRLGSIGKVANISTFAASLTVHVDSVTYQNRIAQAKRVWMLVVRYKKSYPNFILARIVLALRIFGFVTLKILPFPHKALYRIQALYKRL